MIFSFKLKEGFAWWWDFGNHQQLLVAQRQVKPFTPCVPVCVCVSVCLSVSVWGRGTRPKETEGGGGRKEIQIARGGEEGIRFGVALCVCVLLLVLCFAAVFVVVDDGGGDP